MTLGIMGLNATVSINDTKHNVVALFFTVMLSVVLINVVLLSVAAASNHNRRYNGLTAHSAHKLSRWAPSATYEIQTRAMCVTL
jgi:hypothetical protein